MIFAKLTNISAKMYNELEGGTKGYSSRLPRNFHTLVISNRGDFLKMDDLSQ